MTNAATCDAMSKRCENCLRTPEDGEGHSAAHSLKRRVISKNIIRVQNLDKIIKLHADSNFFNLDNAMFIYSEILTCYYLIEYEAQSDPIRA